ncbi:MAG: hypothetical protein F6K40_19120 [Okeania sp. SIO3I5]|uniref:hypothetical protein n=1 Tax=Okeania sp. SIO3I5 TaxID=2607805 RepID=UPI0013B87A1B|nr:hypothetical protein [Okeania sp. SIO3I5]NEQ38258.1 hypothetical protein [Okeania sp. SIO3I5]
MQFPALKNEDSQDLPKYINLRISKTPLMRRIMIEFDWESFLKQESRKAIEQYNKEYQKNKKNMNKAYISGSHCQMKLLNWNG